MPDLTYTPPLNPQVIPPYRRDYSKGAEPEGPQPPSEGPVSVEGAGGTRDPVSGRVTYRKNIDF